MHTQTHQQKHEQTQTQKHILQHGGNRPKQRNLGITRRIWAVGIPRSGWSLESGIRKSHATDFGLGYAHFGWSPESGSLRVWELE